MIFLQNQTLLKTTKELVYLVNCALHRRLPDAEKVCSFDLEKVYTLAKKHSLEAISYAALEQGSYELSEETRKAWSAKREQNVKKDVLFSLEREKIYAFFEENGIWYLPMKGLLLSSLYPVNGWRSFVDNDILFDPSGREKLQAFMAENGYTVKVYPDAHHDIYLKKPFYNFEMHFSLVPDLNELGNLSQLYSYYETVFEKLIRDRAESCAYHMSHEDFYLYSMVHAYKHHICAGTGIRTLVDVYVFLKAYDSVLDTAYIEAELKKMGLYEFEKSIRSLVDKLFFSEKEELLTAEEEAFFLYCVGAGTHGTVENHMENQLSKIAEKKDGGFSFGTKLKYSLRRIFPPMDYFKKNYPFAYKTKVLIPFAVIYRLIKSVFFSKSAIPELRYLFKNGKK